MELKKHILVLLERIGLSETEAKFYLNVYQYPQKTIAELQKLCGFSRATSYRAFDHLKDLKLLTSSPENWRKNVEAVSLRTIAEKLGRESLKLRKVEFELKKLENLLDLTNYQATLEPVEIFSDQNQITEEVARNIQASLIVEGANGPTLAAADEILKEKDIVVVPDILANCGGVTVSYFEWVQNKYGYYWSEDEVNAKHDQFMDQAFETVWFSSKQYKTTMRLGAYITALKKLEKAIEYKGLY